MGLWSWLFGTKKQEPVRRTRPTISRSSAAVRRLAARRGVSIWDLDLMYDESIFEELLLLGLLLSDDGSCYVDDSNFVEEDISGSTVEDTTEETLEVAPPAGETADTEVETTTEVETETVVETAPPVVEVAPLPEPPPPPA